MRIIRSTVECFCLLVALPALGGIPEPSRAPISWELQFSFHDPERITLTLPGDARPTTYWYMRYRVENDTGQEIQFFPSVELVTESLEVVQGGDLISPTVYDAIIQRHHVTDPFMVEPRRAMGPLLQGPDNAKGSVAVFRQFDPEADRFTIYFSGLSGEIQRIPNPTFDPKAPESDDNPRLFTLRKTLAIHYILPGDAQTRSLAEPVREKREWIMR